MTERKVLRVAPARGGLQIAAAWRIWVQGDEFYVAGRDLIQHGKISFHRNNKWQFRLGAQVHHLTSKLNLSNNWIHALELAFLASENTFLPKQQREADVLQIETPHASKLLIDILLSQASQRIPPLPIEMSGTPIKTFKLRNGRALLIICRVAPLTTQDSEVIGNIRSGLKINFERSIPKNDEFYAEAMSISFEQDKGNVICIVPVGSESLSINPGAV